MMYYSIRSPSLTVYFRTARWIPDMIPIGETSFADIILYIEYNKVTTKRLSISMGKITTTTVVPQLDIDMSKLTISDTDYDRCFIALTTVLINNMLLEGKHTMEGDKIIELDPVFKQVFFQYVSQLIKCI